MIAGEFGGIRGDIGGIPGGGLTLAGISRILVVSRTRWSRSRHPARRGETDFAPATLKPPCSPMTGQPPPRLQSAFRHGQGRSRAPPHHRAAAPAWHGEMPAAPFREPRDCVYRRRGRRIWPRPARYPSASKSSLLRSARECDANPAGFAETDRESCLVAITPRLAAHPSGRPSLLQREKLPAPWPRSTPQPVPARTYVVRRPLAPAAEIL